MRHAPYEKDKYSKQQNDHFISEMKRLRGIDFAYLGQHVQVSGRDGIIAGMHDANLWVRFESNGSNPSHEGNCHPTWDIAYFDESGVVMADYRKPQVDRPRQAG